jgi:hypothetical protein
MAKLWMDSGDHYEEVPDVPDSEVTDWKHVQEALRADLLVFAEDKLESSRRYRLDSGFDQGSEMSGDTDCDIADAFWRLETRPLCRALLKLDPNNVILNKILAVSDRHEAFHVFDEDPVLAPMVARMGGRWMESTFPLTYDSCHRMSETVAFFDGFEGRLCDTLRFIAFPRRTTGVFASLGLGRRYEITGSGEKRALRSLPAAEGLSAEYDRLRVRVLGE